MSDSDYEASDEVLPDDEFDATNFRAISFSELDDRLLDSLGIAKDRIGSVTTNEFIVEAYIAATNLRNICGDADAMIADQAETIRSNLLVVATMIERRPAELVIAASKSADDPKQFLFEIIDTLTKYYVETTRDDKEESLERTR